MTEAWINKAYDQYRPSVLSQNDVIRIHNRSTDEL